MSQRIALSPDSTQLYLERGELLLIHQEKNEARADFYTCIHSGLVNTRSLLGLSKSLLYLDLPDSALYYIDLALEPAPAQPSLLECKAAVLDRLSRSCDAARVYDKLLLLADHPAPSLFLDAADAWLNCPDPSGNAKAERALLEGMERIGQLHVLEKALVNIYLLEHKYRDALAVQSQIIDHWSVKTKPYYERAEIYLLLGEKDLATNDLHLALLSMDNMPGYKSSTPAMKEMRSTIVSLLNQTGD